MGTRWECERECCLCHRRDSTLGKLLGPVGMFRRGVPERSFQGTLSIPNLSGGGIIDLRLLPMCVGEDRATGQAIFVHRLCAIWSPEVYQTDEGTVKNILTAMKRGRAIRWVPSEVKRINRLLWRYLDWHHKIFYLAWLRTLCLKSTSRTCVNRCAKCNKTGATIGCVLERCQCSFHLSCAREAGCYFLPLRYLLR